MPPKRFPDHSFDAVSVNGPGKRSLACNDAQSGVLSIVADVENLEVLVLNALRIKKHISHFCLDEAAETAKTIKAKKTYFTHISHLMGFHKSVNPKLPAGMKLSFDGLKISIPE